MRIHTYTVTEDDLRAAAKAAGEFGHGRVFLEFTRHGSRSHDRAYEVHLTGDGTVNKRRVNYGTARDRDRFDRPYAATWDAWGVFLAELFLRDPDMRATYYKDAEDFHKKTGNMFVGVGM